MNFIKVVILVFMKDIKDELRRKENILSSLFFALLSLVLFHFSVDMTSIDLSKEGAGLMWLIIIFAGTIFIQNIFRKEEENGVFLALLLAPVDRAAIYLAKFLVCFVFLAILEVFLFVLSFFFFGAAVFDSPLQLTVVALAVNIGFSALGTLISSLLMNQKGSSILYPLLLYPLLFPLFAAAATLTQLSIKSSLAFSDPWLRLIILFDMIFLGTSSMLFESVVED
jgi:heme exporter protein B